MVLRQPRGFAWDLERDVIFMLYQIHHGAVRFGAETILTDINFEIRSTEKIAVVGRNGCGKTTLLRLIAGEAELAKRDSDEDIYIAKAGSPSIGYLKQMAFADDNATLEEEIRMAFAPLLSLQAQMEEWLSRLGGEGCDAGEAQRLAEKYAAAEERFSWMGGYDYEREYEIVLGKFGFTRADWGKRLTEFSGGQRTKIAFAKLLLSRPDILLLDEPTNHLDMETVEWLEGYLKNYNRAVVVVSHDRMFLDQITDVVYEIEYKTAKRYPGNYTAFTEQKRANWEKQQKDHTLQQKEIARLSQLAEKFLHHPTKVSMARSKLKQIEHMDIVEAPARYDLRTFHANCTPARESGKEVLAVSHLAIGYSQVLSEADFALRKGQKLAVLGANGTGKSTLLKTLTGQLPALGGSYRYGYQVDVGYFDQQIAQYESAKTVLDEFWDEFPQMTQTEVRTLLGSFLFTQDEVFKQVSMLSGGERSRLALAKLFKRRPNLLILDEPTNHMDIVGKETLEAMLQDFQGTVLLVSHDRYFIREVADSLLIFGAGGMQYYEGGYGQYLAERATPEEPAQNNGALNAEPPQKEASPAGSPKHGLPGGNPARKHAGNPGKELSRLTKRLQQTEEKIAACEAELQEARDAMLDPDHAADYKMLEELRQRAEEKENELDELMYEWNELDSQLQTLT